MPFRSSRSPFVALQNTGKILGLSPTYLFSLKSFLDCLEDDQADILWDNIETLDESQKELTESGPSVFQVSGWSQGDTSTRKRWDCWCAAHRVATKRKDDGEENTQLRPTIVLEFELIHDKINPLAQKSPPPSPGELMTEMGGSSSTSRGGSTKSGSSSPPPSVTTIASDGTTKVSTAVKMSRAKGGLEGMPYIPTPEQFVESTQPSSKPLKALARLRRHGGQKSGRRPRPGRARNSQQDVNEVGEEGAMLDMFGILSQVNEQLTAQNELQGFLKVAVSVIREITGFSRVMIYQFDERWNGQVVCELVDWDDTHDLYRGLHFPATDIPKQARDLYMINKVRLLYDRDQSSARMVCKDVDELNSPVDMTHSFLRAMSPIHVKYLANMGVRASMSISITAFDQLWGLIALHTYGSKGKRVSFPMRQLCRLIGESVSRNIERLSYTRRLSARKLINTLPTDKNPSGYIISNAEDLLTLFDADFGVIAIGNEAKILGPLSASQEVLAVTEYLRIKKFQQVVTSQDVAADFPDMVLPNGLEVIAGLLLIPLSNSGIDFITFLRKAQTRHVNWAGKPFKEGQEGTAALEPRKSFKIWSETVIGTCRAWKDEELETASVLCLVYGKFISVWRQREQAMQYNQLNKLLLSNATHEVRTPLNHIINYLEMALDSQLDPDTRENLSKSHMASKSLLFVINDLLDLTRHEEGNKLFLQEPFDVSGTIREAVEMHEWEAKRRKIEFTLETSPEKCFVVGDAARVRQIVVNTVSNSIKFTEQGHIHVEMRRRTEEEMTAELPEGCDMEIELVVSDTGAGIAREKLEALFREFEQVESVIAEPNQKRLDNESQDSRSPSSSPPPPPAMTTMTTMDTELGGAHGGGHRKDASSGESSLGLGLAIVARVVRNMGGQLRVDSTVGEGSRFTFYLPFRSSSPQEAASRSGSESKMRRSNSFESGGSGNSGSVKSEINSLVEAISAPHLDDHNATPQRRQSADMGRVSSASGAGDSAGDLGHRSSGGALEASGPRGVSAAPPRPTGALKRNPSATEGTRQVTGSAVPLRSVKVDPHSLDTLDRSQEALQEQQQHQQERRGTQQSPRLPQHRQGPHSTTMVTQREEKPSAMRRETPPDFVRLPSKTSSNETTTTAMQSPAMSTPSSSESATGASGAAPTSSRRRGPIVRGQVSGASKGDKLQPLRVLVVEDDPINRMILKKRLGIDGHTVLLAVNGEEGFRQFEKDGNEMDVILMDLQMPICNGQESCKRIRLCESQRSQGNQLANRPAAHVLNGRIPIFAVSATLDYSMRQEMCDIGMDGWLLKPIDFSRLHSLLKGITHQEHRETERWKPGHVWEKGGWLSDPANRPIAGGGNPP